MDTALPAFATSLFLHLVRTSAFMAVVPVFGRQRDSMFLRLVLALTMAVVFWWVGQQQVPLPGSVLALGVMAVREAVVGVALGFAVLIITTVAVAAGEIVSTEMGFSMARALDPESGSESSVMSQLFQVFAFLLILHFDLHHEVLRILEQTFRSIPVGAPFDLQPIWFGLRGLVAASLLLALQYAFPVLGVMLLLTTALVLLGRAVPNINLMEFGYAARVLLALLAGAYFLAQGSPFLVRSFAGLLGSTRAMFPV
ncbi:MAG TPA: flagellar biosynthetic protein FliR [Planctomycetota bacterium]|nr:flagellar biosynthetic protein FliR [Planctomycetota bacterium]